MKQTQWGNTALGGVLFDAHKLTVQLKVAVGLFLQRKHGPDRSLLTMHIYYDSLLVTNLQEKMTNCKQ